MRKNKLLSYFLTLLFTIVICTSLVYSENISNLFGYSRAAISYYGSTGQEVKNIQYQLKKWGYYNGGIDGVYGYGTYTAVKSFQYKNRLKVDGVAGPETLSALGLATGTPVAQNVSTANKDINLLAHLIHGEARGEPYLGQVAVGAVIMNRIRDGKFPKTIAGVIYQPGAFDAVKDGQINLEPDSNAYKAARDAISGWDPTYGCIYYYNPDTATSNWIWSRKIIVKIGKHNFAK
ncbi:MAG: spore cortex-lytic enzyme [Clostridia bacterium]|nr:spore cortex-lytic enzyme [Clostridia bacterium]